ncbi:MAG: histidine phosphatase family protein [Idiomarina sp.]|nr:histidine phosphatase family protein [Idiomarina sp.]
MPSIYLMRHGQASFYSADYDQLSPIGKEQARFNGRWLAQQGKVPKLIFHGSLKRQRQSVTALLEGLQAGVHTSPPSVYEDPAWNEFDHLAVLQAHARHAGPLAQLMDSIPETAVAQREAAFSDYFSAAMARWVTHQTAAGEQTVYPETFSAFETRVKQALQKVHQHNQDRMLVVTSGGPISMVAKQLMQLDTRAALELNWRLVNAGLTKLGWRAGRAPQLISLNEHMHFSGKQAHLLTAR